MSDERTARALETLAREQRETNRLAERNSALAEQSNQLAEEANELVRDHEREARYRLQAEYEEAERTLRFERATREAHVGQVLYVIRSIDAKLTAGDATALDLIRYVRVHEQAEILLAESTGEARRELARTLRTSHPPLGKEPVIAASAERLAVAVMELREHLVRSDVLLDPIESLVCSDLFCFPGNLLNYVLEGLKGNQAQDDADELQDREVGDEDEDEDGFAKTVVHWTPAARPYALTGTVSERRLNAELLNSSLEEKRRSWEPFYRRATATTGFDPRGAAMIEAMRSDAADAARGGYLQGEGNFLPMRVSEAGEQAFAPLLRRGDKIPTPVAPLVDSRRFLSAVASGESLDSLWETFVAAPARAVWEDYKAAEQREAAVQVQQAQEEATRILVPQREFEAKCRNLILADKYIVWALAQPALNATTRKAAEKQLMQVLAPAFEPVLGTESEGRHRHAAAAQEVLRRLTGHASLPEQQGLNRSGFIVAGVLVALVGLFFQAMLVLVGLGLIGVGVYQIATKTMPKRTYPQVDLAAAKALAYPASL